VGRAIDMGELGRLLPLVAERAERSYSRHLRLSLRIARSHGVVTTFFQHHGQWRKLGALAVSGEVWLEMTLGTNADLWQHVDVSAALDNFVVKAPDADCPAGSDPRGS
jgi:hypothetical protein